MKRVYSTESLAEVGHFRNVLEQNGIPCVIKNEQLSGALGEVPFLECLPELWVVNDGDLAKAEALVADLKKPGQQGQDWRCRHCKEHNDSQYAVCWNCGKPDEAA